MTTNAEKTKESVRNVFDGLASKKVWERLYSGKVARLSSNFVSRQHAVEALLEPHAVGRVLDLGCRSGNDFEQFSATLNYSPEGVICHDDAIRNAQEMVR